MKRLMLDTHTLLWAIGKSDALPSQTIQYIKDGKNDVFVSAVSLWEIALKYHLGKLSLNFNVQDIPKYCNQMRFTLIPLLPLEALGSLNLPWKENHKDPFDRMLVYQCISQNITLISKDNKMGLYKEDGLDYIW